MEQAGKTCCARTRLREALLRMLEHTELDRICVTELCREAEINRTSFYRYYCLPRDVLVELLEEQAEELAKVTKLPCGSREMQEALLRMCRQLYARKSLVRILILRSRNGGNAGEFKDLFAKKMCKCFAESIEEDNGSLAGAFFTGGLWALLKKWLQEEEPRLPEDVAETVLELVRAGRSFAE